MNHILDGLLLGGLYAGSALGLTLVFGVMRMVNLAHGEILIGAAYLSVIVVSHFGFDPLASLVSVAPVMFVLAYPLQRFILGPLIAHGLEGQLVATFGLSIVAQTIFVLAFGGNPKALDAPYTLTGTTVAGTSVRTTFPWNDLPTYGSTPRVRDPSSSSFHSRSGSNRTMSASDPGAIAPFWG